MLADEVDYVIGVDTHRDQHTLAVVAAATGAVVAQSQVATNVRGYGEAMRFAERNALGALSRTGFRGDLCTRMLSWGEEILRCHVETEEVPRGAA